MTGSDDTKEYEPGCNRNIIGSNDTKNGRGCNRNITGSDDTKKDGRGCYRNITGSDGTKKKMVVAVTETSLDLMIQKRWSWLLQKHHWI